MPQRLQQSVEVTEKLTGLRLDQAAAELFPDFSRARLQQWVRDGGLTLNGHTAKPKDKVALGDQLVLEVELEVQTDHQAQAIALDIVYEDEAIIVLNKPAGLVVHPAAGHQDGTLLNALLHHEPMLDKVPRAGIVHRLDKDTSGLMVVARSLEAQNSLVTQLQDRSMGREYDAVVVGALISGGTVDAPIGRHPKDRKRQAVVSHGGKPAVTHYRVVERFRGHSHIRCKLETGRTHQIRVHMAHLHHALVGDPVYAGRMRIPPGSSDALKEIVRVFPRQALHARQLTLQHPLTGETMTWRRDSPEDMQTLLRILAEDTAAFS
ncbi:RNA pseudouridine synthase [Terasakiispira papahanaumokuakeensis]|uniref:Pseudouridine synthase n=1 Tax=Terasakiispira papahanaumokuakeensis TaxID=197479 RepID=A0A1E2VCI7_9GAMM|nr:23S rRNA pseudouridine(1911/1915/1917) synthase RluD [Terasakiispira papahanaumokuakeensis]ODC04536.1 RNA pseudouridine synthase [Terasakiispira papahanaumokuakeensis]